jgi:hypothetical protein
MKASVYENTYNIRGYPLQEATNITVSLSMVYHCNQQSINERVLFII